LQAWFKHGTKNINLVFYPFGSIIFHRKMPVIIFNTFPNHKSKTPLAFQMQLLEYKLQLVKIP